MKACQYIKKFKYHNLVLKIAIPHLKYSFSFVTFFVFYITIGIH